MSTLDEITKEKQLLGEALARVDAQREKLISQLNELEAAERVLARYSTGTQARKTSSAKMPTTGAKAAAPARLRGRRRIVTAKSAGGSRSSPSLNDQVLALATGKTQQEITADPLTLSSPTKASLFRIILWRCLAGSERGITQQRPHNLRQRSPQMISKRSLSKRTRCHPAGG